MNIRKLTYLTASLLTVAFTSNVWAQTIQNPGDSATILISGTNSSSSTEIGGNTWNQFSSSIVPENLLDLNGVASGISISYENTGGFVANSRGENLEVTSHGVTFPSSVTHSYVADNFDGRDGLVVLRFISDFELSIDFTVISSVAHGSPPEGRNIVHWNVGGNYEGTGNRTFTGGTTLTLDASKFNVVGDDTFRYDTGVLSSMSSTFDSDLSKWILDLQVGHGGSTNNAVTAINGIHMNVTAIPEPGTLALLGIALGALVLFRRRH